MEESGISVEFTKEELSIIYEVFNKLANRSLAKWTSLIPKDGEYRSEECFRQWILTGKLHRIRSKIKETARTGNGTEEKGGENIMLDDYLDKLI